MKIAGMNETQEMYKKNLELLTIWLRDCVEAISEEELWKKIEVSYNAEGYPICKYHRDEGCFHITSNQPVREAEIWQENIQHDGAGAVFLYGTGFGYPIFEIFAHKKLHTLVVVFEEDLYLFKAMLYYFDFEPVIRTGKIVFIVGDSDFHAQALEDLYFSIYFISCTSPVIAWTVTARRNFKKEYLQIHKDVFKKLSLMAFYLGNDHKDNLIGFSNLVANAKEIIKNPGIGCLKDKYKGMPAFIIANGPSLDKSIGQIKKIAGRGLVICLESAIVPLTKHSIEPDIIAVIERTKNTYTFHFKNRNYSKNISLLALAVSDKRVFSSFQGGKIPIFRDREILNQWFCEYLGDGFLIDAGANVSHLATEIALHAGADPIVFVGQDFAYGPNEATHSKDSLYFTEAGRHSRELIHAWPTVIVEGNDGGMIRSNRLWCDFKLGLEQKIALHPDRIFLNATEGGAKILGTKYVGLNDVIQEYCIRSLPSRVNEIIEENMPEYFSEKKERVDALVKDIKETLQLLREAKRETGAAKLNCKRMLCLLAENVDGQYNDILEGAYQNNTNIFNHIILNKFLRCFSQQVFFANYYLINCLKMIDTPEKIEEVFKIHYNFFCQLNVVFHSVSIHMENAVEFLEDALHSFEISKEMV